MSATAFLPGASPTLPHRGINPRRTRRVFITAQHGKSEGKSVDEGMIVLRMRIKKAKVLESVSKAANDEAKALESGNDHDEEAGDWKEWERRVFSHYHEGVVDSVEMLQAYLMNTRPAVAVGLLALIAISVPFSTSVVMTNALKVARGLLAGCHVCIDIDF